MTIRTRFILLIGGLLAAFTTGALLLRHSHREEAEAVLESLRRERSDLLDRHLHLAGQPLRTFAEDYGQWDEMTAFVARPDPAWAKVNLEASLANFQAHAAWVLRPDGSTLYGVEIMGEPALREFPLRDPRFVAQLRAGRTLHFHERVATGVLELRTAPVLASADSERKGEPRGWLVVARLWNAPFVERLGDTLQSRAVLTGQGVATPLASRIHLDREFSGWDGARVATLHLDYEPRALVDLLGSNDAELYVYCGLGAAVLVLIFLGVYFWVLTPLRRFTQSLEDHRLDAARDLLPRQDEYGRLARLMEQSFQQRDALTREIEERRRAESALQQSEESLRAALELRQRLARDLHDGVIQSIYAAGLGLETLRGDLRGGAPAAAEAKLDAAQRSLNQTIAEVRNFILGLEPATEPAARQDFPHALASLTATMRVLHPVDFRLDLDPGAARRLTAGQELHLLQITREAVSNALRHGSATELTLTLRATEGVGVVYEVQDDGRGFDPAQTRQGSGLANIAARAREMRADFTLRSTLGKGTRLVLRISPATRI